MVRAIKKNRKIEESHKEDYDHSLASNMEYPFLVNEKIMESL